MISRSAEQTFEIYDRLANDGKVKRKPNDFQSRLGVTQEPLIDADLQMISPLHTMLRTWDFIIKIICFIRAEMYTFSTEANILKDKYDDYKKAKKSLIDIDKKEIDIIMEVPDSTGKGGTSTNGNTVPIILGNDKNRQLLSSLVPDNYREINNDIILRLWLIMSIYNSNDEVNEYFNDFCNETCILLLTSFNKDQKNWIYISNCSWFTSPFLGTYSSKW